MLRENSNASQDPSMKLTNDESVWSRAWETRSVETGIFSLFFSLFFQESLAKKKQEASSLRTRFSFHLVARVCTCRKCLENFFSRYRLWRSALTRLGW